MITLLTLFGWIMFLLTFNNLDNYEISDRKLIIKRMLLKPKWIIPIENIIKVYQTNFPDELLIKGAKYYPNFIFNYVQIEYKQNSEWCTAYITSSYYWLFIKQIELIQANKDISGFELFSIKPVIKTILSFCFISLLFSIGCDFIFMNIKYFSVWILLVVAIIEFIVIRRKLRNTASIIGGKYIADHLLIDGK